VFFIAATDTWVEVDTRKLLAEFYPETKQISDSLTGNASVIRCEKVRKLLGFAPLYSWRDIESPNPSLTPC
jgi:hypothetical protein